MRSMKWMMVALLGSTLAACGSGGSSTASSGGSILAARSGLAAYSEAQGATDLAPVSTTNHAAFVELFLFSVIESDDKAAGYVFRPDDFTPPTVGGDGNLLAPKALSPDAVTEDIIAQLGGDGSKKDVQARYDNTGTIPCANGGNIIITGDLDTNSTAGTLNVQYTNCITESGLFRKQGVSKVYIAKRDPTTGTFLDFTVDYEGLSVETSWNYFVYTGSQHVVRTLTNGDYTKVLVETDLKRDDQAGFLYLDNTRNDIDLRGQSITGRLCHGNHGCVEVSTKVPFKDSSRTGEINMVGANNSSIQLFYDKLTRTLQSRIDGYGNGAYGAPILVSDLL
ncbi:MAG: hypothetical protein R3E93_10310 [Thiothrix sp.]